jgi:hypothetical protein
MNALVMLAGLTATVAIAADLPCKVSWVGNSLSGKDGWIAQDIEDIEVTPDGTVVTNVGWDEGGYNVEQFVDGRFIKAALHTHGWGNEGGSAIAANTRYLFIGQGMENERGGLKGQSWPPKGMRWSGVSRRLRSDISKPAPFPGGHGGEGDTLKSTFLPIYEFSEKGEAAKTISGLAASETRLYVACRADNSIKVFDAETMQLLNSFALECPGKLALAPAGVLYATQCKPGAPAVAKLALDGKVIRTQPLAAEVVPLDIAASADGKVLISDGGPSQQILVLDADLQQRSTIGTAGGVLAGPVVGATGDLRFNRPRGVGIDAQGNVYVASSNSVGGGSTVLECYAPDLALRWWRMGLTFVDLCDLDPANETTLHTKDKLFTLDYAKPAGQQWTYTAYTVNALKYPDDPRLHTWPTHVWVRRIAGQPMMFVTGMTGEFLSVYRYNPKSDGYIAIPAALFFRHRVKDREDGWPPHQPDADAWLWTDADGDGRMDADEYAALPTGGNIFWPDANGGIWQERQGSIAYLPFGGITAQGVPSWAIDKTRVLPKPAEFTQVRRVHYETDRDLLLVGGNNAEDHNQHWKPMGPILATYDNALGGTPKLRWVITLPYEKGSAHHESREPISFDVAGDYVFVAYTRGLAADGVKNAYIKVYRLADGVFVGNLVAERQLGEGGLLDLVESVRAVRRTNGEYAVFLEEDMKAKIILFQWQPQAAGESAAK